MTISSLRVRLLIAGALAIGLALAAAVLGLMVLFERHVTRRVDAELNVHLTQLIAGLDRASEPGAGITLQRRPAEPRFDRPLSGLYWQIAIAPEGRVLRSRSLWDFELDLPRDDLAEGVVHSHRLAGPGGARLYVLERRAALPERLGDVGVRVAVAIDEADLDRATRDFATELLPMATLLAGLLLLAGWLQVTIGLKPLASLRDQLAEVRSGRARRLGAAFPDEVRPLARQVDDLLEAREAELEKARHRAGDLAHGLKTPLQVLIGEAGRLSERGEADSARQILSLAEAMQRHIDRELKRARMAPVSASTVTDVAVVVGRVVDVVQRTPDGARLAWQVDRGAGLMASIDADDLAEALGNLIENAARHARHRVVVSASAAGEMIEISVVDDGAGLDEDQLARAVERGTRLDESTAGSGLGLAIVREIAAHAGGELVLESTHPGLGATIRVERA